MGVACRGFDRAAAELDDVLSNPQSTRSPVASQMEEKAWKQAERRNKSSLRSRMILVNASQDAVVMCYRIGAEVLSELCQLVLFHTRQQLH